LRRRTPLKIKYGCSEDGTVELRVGNKVVASSNIKANQMFEYVLSWKYGTKTIQVKCTDKVLNKSIYKFTLFLDQIPPHKPSLQVIKEKGKYILKVSCVGGTKVKTYIGANVLGEQKCNGRSVSFDLPSNLALDVHYIFRANVVDDVGNISEPGQIEFIIDQKDIVNNPKKQKTETPICTGNLYIDDRKLKIEMRNFGCSDFSQSVGLLDIKTFLKDKKKVANVFIKTPLLAKVSISIYHCKYLPGILGRLFPVCFYRYVGDFKKTMPLRYSVKYSGKDYVPIKNYKNNYIEIPMTNAPLQGNMTLTLWIHSFINDSLTKLGIRFPYFASIKEQLGKWSFNLSFSYPKPIQYKKPFNWIFKDYNAVHVSQRYGHVRNGRFHHGVDFGVYKKPIIVPLDGVVVAARYDRHAKCYAGGYYIALRHENGMYSYYFHLDSLYINGKKIRPGLRLSTGDLLALTGNSGEYRCKPLPYHLHFEIRTCRYSKCSLNPIYYMDADWTRLGYWRFK